METVEYMQEMENLRRRAEHRRINADMKRRGTYPKAATRVQRLFWSAGDPPRDILVFCAD